MSRGERAGLAVARKLRLAGWRADARHSGRARLRRRIASAFDGVDGRGRYPLWPLWGVAGAARRAVGSCRCGRPGSLLRPPSSWRSRLFAFGSAQSTPWRRHIRGDRGTAFKSSSGATGDGASEHRICLAARRSEMIRQPGRTVCAVRHSVVFRHRWRWLGRAGNAPRSPDRSRIAESANCSPLRRRRRDRTSCWLPLLGHFIAGVPGAAIATVAMCGPSCVLACAVSQAVEYFRHARWRIAIEAGLVPVTIGLIAASALIIVQGADHDWACFAITATTFALVYWTRLSPLVAFGCAALLGLGGFV
jgi:hypothetical protein